MYFAIDENAYPPDRARKRGVNIGERYGALVVVGDTGEVDSKGNKKYFCQCDCGKTVVRTTRYLKRPGQKTFSCGCQKGIFHMTHGLSKKDDRLYRIWNAMRWRANEKNATAKTYREKGIKCCEEWNDYMSFRCWALSNGYNDNLSLDRIDNNGDYCPENCRWADAFTQANNTSHNNLVTVNGETKTISEWAREKNINYSTLRSRVNRQHIEGERLFANTMATRDEKTGRFIGGYDL